MCHHCRPLLAEAVPKLNTLCSVSLLTKPFTVRRCLEHGSDIEQTFRAWSPLMKAAESGFEDITNLLLQLRANLEVRNKTGRTALSFAIDPSAGRYHCYDCDYVYDYQCYIY